MGKEHWGTVSGIVMKPFYQESKILSPDLSTQVLATSREIHIITHIPLHFKKRLWTTSSNASLLHVPQSDSDQHMSVDAQGVLRCASVLGAMSVGYYRNN